MKISNLDVKILKNIKYKLLPILIAGSIGIGLTACTSRGSTGRSTSRYDDYSNYYSENYSNVPSYNDGDLENSTDVEQNNHVEESSSEPTIKLEDYNLDGVMVQFDANDTRAIEEFIASIKVEYKDSDLYNVSDAIDTYERMDLVESNSNTLITNNKINSNLFYELVVKNNTEFLSSDKTNKYNNIDQTRLKEIVNIISNHLNSLLEESNDIDVNNLDNNLKALKILEFKSFGNAFVDMDNPMLCLNFTAIQSLQNQNPDINMLQRVIEHESSHLVQVSYPKEDEFEYNMGISYSYNNLKVNSLYWQWFVEASAEKLTLKKVSDNPFNYVDQVKGLESLTLASITNVNEVDEIEKLSLQNDLGKLFELFHVDTDQEKQEIVNMMFAYDIIFTENDDFLEQYKATKGEMDLLSLYDYKDEVKPSIASTLTKIFYTNLSNSLEANPSSLSDVYLLMRTFETEMCRLTDYDNTSKEKINTTFINNYSNIQNQFFETLSTKTNMESKELKDLYYLYSEAYCDNAKFKTEEDYQINADVEWLSEEQNEFLEHASKSRVYHINKNINR